LLGLKEVQKTPKSPIERNYRGCFKIVNYFLKILKNQERYIIVMSIFSENSESIVARAQNYGQKTNQK